MRVNAAMAYGVISSVYVCKKGEGLPWHDHKHQKVTHGHCVVVGSTLLEIEGELPRTMQPKDMNVELAWDKRHQITALEDDTVFVNMMSIPKNPDPAVEPYLNRVRLIDGTVEVTRLDGTVYVEKPAA